MDQNLLILLFSSGAFIIGLVRWDKSNHLIKNGKVTRGIIFKNNYKESNDSAGKYHPVVRFLTEDDIWITQELDIGFSPKMKQGKKVDLIYDPKYPKNVTFHSNLNLKYVPIGLILIGLSGMIYGILKFFNLI